MAGTVQRVTPLDRFMVRARFAALLVDLDLRVSVKPDTVIYVRMGDWL